MNLNVKIYIMQYTVVFVWLPFMSQAIYKTLSKNPTSTIQVKLKSNKYSPN